MNIPEEVFQAAFGASVLHMPTEGYLRYASRLVAEWARKEALKEARSAVRSLGVINGWIDRGDALAAIDALAEGDNTNE